MSYAISSYLSLLKTCLLRDFEGFCSHWDTTKLVNEATCLAYDNWILLGLEPSFNPVITPIAMTPIDAHKLTAKGINKKELFFFLGSEKWLFKGNDSISWIIVWLLSSRETLIAFSFKFFLKSLIFIISSSPFYLL